MAEIPIRCFSVSVIVLRQAADTGPEVLLLRRTETLAGTWCQVAGGLEPGETAWQAALRELHEETGLAPTALYSADICEQFYEADRDAVTICPVFVAYVDATAAVEINVEHSAFRWVTFAEAIEMVPFAGQRKVLRHVEQEFSDRSPDRHLLIDMAASNPR